MFSDYYSSLSQIIFYCAKHLRLFIVAWFIIHVFHDFFFEPSLESIANTKFFLFWFDWLVNKFWNFGQLCAIHL